MRIKEVMQNQKEFARSNSNDYQYRIRMLDLLKKTIIKNENKLMEAMYRDLGKSNEESYMTELGIVYKEISFMKKHLKKLMKTKRVKTPISDFPSNSFIMKEPYGVVGIISPWNYPVNLTLVPLVGAIAAGNTAIIKPSEFSVHTSMVLAKLINTTFRNEYIYVHLGGVEETTEMLNLKFDFLFFTGSTNVGKIIMRKASEHLTPVCLELGGKSPVIIDESVNLKLVAKRVAFGKTLNSGQTCIAPDYILIKSEVKDHFIKEYINVINEFYPLGIIDKKYGKIINKKHFDRLINYFNTKGKIIGGTINDKTLQIEQTIIDNPRFDDPVMKDEIFGPILPVISFEHLNEAIKYVNDKPKPLALYLFSKKKDVQRKVLNECSFGGGCINDTISHIANDHLPFGGVGSSGISAYHGSFSFDLFSHHKSIVKKSMMFDLSLRYLPFSKKKDSIVRKFLK